MWTNLKWNFLLLVIKFQVLHTPFCSHSSLGRIPWGVPGNPWEESPGSSRQTWVNMYPPQSSSVQAWQSKASVPTRPKAFISFLTTSNHDFLGLPLFHASSIYMHFLTQSSISFLSTWPQPVSLQNTTNHLYAHPISLNSSTLVFFFLKEVPHIHLTICISVFSSIDSCPFFTNFLTRKENANMFT